MIPRWRLGGFIRGKTSSLGEESKKNRIEARTPVSGGETVWLPLGKKVPRPNQSKLLRGGPTRTFFSPIESRNRVIRADLERVQQGGGGEKTKKTSPWKSVRPIGE